MRVLAVDLGTKRTGFAISDPQGKMALALPTLLDVTAVDVAALVEEQHAEEVIVGLSVKITARQIRFLLDRKRAWMVQPLHVPEGVPAELQGYYDPPLQEQQNCGWGTLNADRELEILRDWVARGFKRTDA